MSFDERRSTMKLSSRIAAHFAAPAGGVGGATGAWTARSNRSLNQWLVGQLVLPGSSRVLDLGCGPGLASEALLDVLPNGFVDAVDIDERMVSATRRRSARAVEEGRLMVHQGDALHLPFGPGAFDAVVAVDLAYYLKDLTAALTELARVLRPDGLVAVGITWRHNLTRRQVRRLGTHGANTFAPGELATALGDAGFVRAAEQVQPGDRGVLVRAWTPR